MRIIVTTCDQYMSLIEGWTKLFNKYWGSQYKVELLGFDPPEFELPDNFTFHSAGKQNDFPVKAFYDPFEPIINSFPEDYFVLFGEDTFLISNVDHDMLKKAEEKMHAGEADSIFLFWGGPEQFRRTKKQDANFLEFPQDMDYRVNVQPQIVSKNYFFKYMKPGMSVHDYEIENIKKARNNGATILCGKTPIAPWANIVRLGKFNPYLYENLKKSNGKSFAWNEYQVFNEEDEELIRSYENWTA